MRLLKDRYQKTSIFVIHSGFKRKHILCKLSFENILGAKNNTD